MNTLGQPDREPPQAIETRLLDVLIRAGFIAVLGQQFVNVGDHFQAVFELPVLKEFGVEFLEQPLVPYRTA